MSDALVEPVLAHASRRDAFNRWFVRHEIAWELAMAALAIVYVALGFIVDDAKAAQPEIEAAELILTGVFAVEFGSRILAARSRLDYFRGHWIDLVALVPPIRVARALAWLGVMVVCSAWLYIAEHGVNKAVDNPFDALWWGVVTLTTVGYGDVTPVTTEGRIAAMALMLLGIGLFGAITATITSYLMASDLRRVEKKVEADTALDRTDLALDRVGASLVSELERLAALHRAGDLTSDEFTAAKRQAFGRFTPPTTD
jgi:voltage-gated potassium channel